MDELQNFHVTKRHFYFMFSIHDDEKVILATYWKHFIEIYLSEKTFFSRRQNFARRREIHSEI